MEVDLRHLETGKREVDLELFQFNEPDSRVLIVPLTGLPDAVQRNGKQADAWYRQVINDKAGHGLRSQFAQGVDVTFTGNEAGTYAYGGSGSGSFSDIERLEAKACSFVSVTQSFNTASSMGRLTLSMLLSFAQFEREVTAERKIAASKKKGLWMGGIPPLGYDASADPKLRTLVPNEAEAVTVQTLFDLCVRHGSLRDVEREAAVPGLRSKLHRFKSGRLQGGNQLSRGQIHKILVNPVYLGLIRHHDKTYPGQHPEIVAQDLWDRVQTTLQDAAGKPRGYRSTSGERAALMGKLRDQTGDRLTPTHTVRRGRRLRYYVSNRLIAGGPDPTGWRLPAPRLEAVISDLIADHLVAAATAQRLLAVPDLRRSAAPATGAKDIARRLRKGDPDLLRALLRALADAHRRMALLRQGIALGEIARRSGHLDAHIRTRGKLGFLSPRIQAAIRDGIQPADLTLERMVRRRAPHDWQVQERFYGFHAAAPDPTLPGTIAAKVRRKIPASGAIVSI